MAFGDDSDPPAAPKSRPLAFGMAAIWTLLAFFLRQVLVAMTTGPGEGAALDLVSITGCQIIAYSLVLFAILRVHEPEGSIRHVLGLRRPAVLAVILALALGASLALPSDWIDNLLQAKFPTPAAEREALDQLTNDTTMRHRVTMVLTLALLQPAFEELFFRGALFTPLRRSHRVEVVIMATVAFETLSLVNPRWMLSLLGPSVVFAWLRGTTGSIWAAIAARCAFFGFAVVPIALGRAELKPTPQHLLMSGAVAIVALGGFALLSRYDETSREARVRDAE